MGDKRYIEGLSVEQRLAHCAEEAGELISAIGKTQRWGALSANPELHISKQETNISWLIREWEDLQGAMNRYLHDYVSDLRDKDGIVEEYIRGKCRCPTNKHY